MFPKKRSIGKLSYKRYFVFALLFKGLFFLLTAFLFNKGEGKKDTLNYIFTFTKDYKSYIDPAINLVDHGTCYELSETKKLFAHKMPGMVPIFSPLYYLFGLKWGLSFLVLLQYLLDALCCILLGKIAYRLFNDLRAFYFAYFIYLLSSIVSISAHYAVSELFCASFSILAVYFVSHAEKRSDYLLSGLFATWAVFFRPTSILLFLILPLFIGLNNNKFNWRNIKINRTKVLYFFLPFVLFEGIWILRNQYLMHRFIPAEISQENFANPAIKSIFSLILAMGGDLQSWNPDSEMRWFNYPGAENYDLNYANSNPFPDYLFKCGITLNQLQEVRQKYYLYNDSNSSIKLKTALENDIDASCKTMIKLFKSESPVYYYIISPLRNLKTFLFIKRPYGLSFRNNGIVEKVVRAWHFVFYYFVLIFFFLGFIWNIKSKNHGVWLPIILALLHITLYGFILRFSENRYLVPVHPFMIIASIELFIYWMKRFRLKKIRIN